MVLDILATTAVALSALSMQPKKPADVWIGAISTTIVLSAIWF